MTKHTGFTLQWVRDAHSFGEKNNGKFFERILQRR